MNVKLLLPIGLPVLVLASAGLSPDAIPSRIAAPAQEGDRMVLGEGACLKCHEHAVDALQASTHWTKSFNRLEVTNASKDNIHEYLQGVGQGDKLWEGADVPADVLCVQCHAMVRSKDGNLACQPISCESCHGAAGPGEGHTGWINVHASFGVNNDPSEPTISAKDRAEEDTEHRKKRWDTVAERGMRRSADLHELALNCYGCHFVAHEGLLNAGHPEGKTDFELASWTSGEVRHNFILTYEEDPEQPANAEASTLMKHYHDVPYDTRKQAMFLVGQLAKLETGLRRLAEADMRVEIDGKANPKRLAQSALNLIDAAVEILGAVAEETDLPELGKCMTLWQERAQSSIEELRKHTKFPGKNKPVEGLEAKRATLIEIADEVAEQSRLLAAPRKDFGGAAAFLAEAVGSFEPKGEPHQVK